MSDAISDTVATAPPAPLTLLSPRVLIPFTIVTLIWGSTWLVIRDQLGTVPASWSVTYRFAVASIAMFALLLIRREPIRLERKAMLFAAAVGVAQFMLNFNFVYRAEHYLTSGVVAVIFALLIVPNTLFSWAFLKAPVNRKFLGGGVIAIIGVALLLAHEASAIQGDSKTVALGAALTLAGVCSASAANVMQATKLGKAQSMIVLLAWAMFWGALADAAFAYASVGPPVFDWRWSYGAGLLYLGLAGSVVCFPLYFGIIRQVGAGPAAWSSLLIPVIAMALSTIAESYHWSGLSIAGAVLVLTGLIVAIRPSRNGLA
jgi:drug/metabolite transporter (DMT)-like permease